MADSTLTAIRNKVRRLTRSPSTAQLSNADLDEYVNTFVLYDFPEHLRLFSFKRTFTFVVSPYVDVYDTNTTDPNNQFFNFKNRYITINPPAYVAGNEVFFSQSREQFFGSYPFVNNIVSIGTSGDGVTQVFSGTLNFLDGVGGTVLLQRNVMFSSVDVNGNGLALVDVPVVDAVTGMPTTNGNLYVPGTQPATPPTVVLPNNTVNYVTGVFNITFNAAPASGQEINSQTVPVQTAMPNAILYFNDAFTVRPVPDQPYQVNVEVFVRPTELLTAAQTPDLEGFWQYIAYGAGKKVFEDRMDLESVNAIMPEFKQQERLVLRRTIVQQTPERVATIYTENVSGMYGPGFFSGGGSF